MKLELAKGVRDFSPEEKLLRDDVVNKIITVFERYGFVPLETPMFERYDTLSAKFGAGDVSDALKETFTFQDQGKRELGLRFDLTVPLARYIATHPQIKMPFKRYQIGSVFRDGPIKLGRYREFAQCDVDIVGAKDLKAEAELMLLSIDVFKKLKLEANIVVNSRKLLEGILELFDIKPEQYKEVITILDKTNKIGMAGVEKELSAIGIDRKTTKKITDILDTRGKTESILEKLKKTVTNERGQEGIKELEELFSLLKGNPEIKLDISLARGLSYYTGIVFEGFLRNSKIKSSICGGGRYDTMIGEYTGGKREYPAIGISFGIEPIIESMKLTKPNLKKTKTKVFVIPINTYKQSLEIVQELRKEGINADIDLMGKSISKNLDYVNAQGIPAAIIIGEDELKKNLPKFKNMLTGKEEHLTLAAIKAKLME